MVGVPEDEAARALSAGKVGDLLDEVYNNFAIYRVSGGVVVRGVLLHACMGAQRSCGLLHLLV